MGWRCVEKIAAFRQGPLPPLKERGGAHRATSPESGRAAPPPDDRRRRRLARGRGQARRAGDREVGASSRRAAPASGREIEGLASRHPLALRRIVRMVGSRQQDPRALCGIALSRAAEDARAINRVPGFEYDQLMVMGNPRTAGTAVDAPIYNNDGTLAGACTPRARCVADRLCRGALRRQRQDRD